MRKQRLLPQRFSRAGPDAFSEFYRQHHGFLRDWSRHRD
jgi:hypothetical protein